MFFSQFARHFEILFVSVVAFLHQCKRAEIEEEESFSFFFAHIVVLQIFKSKIYASYVDIYILEGANLGSFFWEHSTEIVNSVTNPKNVNIIYRKFIFETKESE